MLFFPSTSLIPLLSLNLPFDLLHLQPCPSPHSRGSHPAGPVFSGLPRGPPCATHCSSSKSSRLVLLPISASALLPALQRTWRRRLGFFLLGTLLLRHSAYLVLPLCSLSSEEGTFFFVLTHPSTSLPDSISSFFLFWKLSSSAFFFLCLYIFFSSLQT